MNKPNSIDNYIADFPEETRQILQQVRLTVSKAAPKAEETINYGIPTFTLNGNLVHLQDIKAISDFIPHHPELKPLKMNCQCIKVLKVLYNFL